MGILNEEFYHNAEGIFLEKNTVIGNCISRNSYFVLKHKLLMEGQGSVQELYKCFLQSLYFSITVNENEKSVKFNLDDNFFFAKLIGQTNHIEFNHDLQNVLSALKNIHNENDIPLITGLAKYIPFFKNYHLDEQEEREIKFLLLNEHLDEWYYVYTYSLYNMNYFKPCSVNQSIGVMPKKDLYEALSARVDIDTIVPNFNNLSLANDNVKNSIMETVSKFYKKKENDTLYGLEAERWLCNYLEHNRLFFSASARQRDEDLYFESENLRLICTWFNNRKRQFIYLIQSFDIVNDSVLTAFVEKLEGSISAWNQFRSVFLHQYFMKIDYLDNNIVESIHNLIDKDVLLIKFIEQHMQDIVQKLEGGKTL